MFLNPKELLGYINLIKSQELTQEMKDNTKDAKNHFPNSQSNGND